MWWEYEGDFFSPDADADLLKALDMSFVSNLTVDVEDLAAVALVTDDGMAESLREVSSELVAPPRHRPKIERGQATEARGGMPTAHHEARVRFLAADGAANVALVLLHVTRDECSVPLLYAVIAETGTEVDQSLG